MGLWVQELGPKYARNVKVSMDEMRRKQFAAAKIVMRNQASFLRDGVAPEPSPAEAKLAPVGNVTKDDVRLHIDEEGGKVRMHAYMHTCIVTTGCYNCGWKFHEESRSLLHPHASL